MISISESNSTRIVQFDGTNFSNWKYRLRILLDEKGLRKYIDEALSDILAGIESTEREKYRKEEKACISIIVQSVHDGQLEYIKDKTLAKDMFDGLTAVFERKSIAGQLLLRKQLLTMKMADGTSMNEHFLKFDKHVRDLKSIGAKMEDLDVICHLLLTLPRSYDNLVTALETMYPKDLSLEFVKSRLIDESGKRGGGGSNSGSGESHAMQARNSNIVCFKCGKKGHIKSMCKSKRTNDAKSNKNGADASTASSAKHKDDESTLCAIESDGEIRNHEANKKPVAQTTRTDMNEHVKGECGNDDTMQIKFILDSGATEHMVSSTYKNHFHELNEIDGVKISVAKQNEVMTARHRGSMKVRTTHGDCDAKTIANVLVVSDLKCNLMSISALTNRGYAINFRKEFAYIMIKG